MAKRLREKSFDDGNLKLAIIIPDCHIPYHHVKAYNLMIKVMEDLSPDAIYLTGDYADFYAINGHGPKDPRVVTAMKEEVDGVNACLDELDLKFPDAKKVYVQGNHENRLERFIQNKCPEFYGFVDCETLFKLRERPGWAWIPYRPGQRAKVLNSRLLIRHEPIGQNAQTTLNRALSSVVFGHVHRRMEAVTRSLEGNQFVCFSPGWLGDQRKAAIFDYVKGHFTWELGFALVWVDESGNFVHEIVSIQEDMSCIANGKRYK